MQNILTSPLVENQEKIFDNPYDKSHRKWTTITLILLLFFSLLLTILVWRLGYLIAGFILVILGLFLEWFYHDYTKPSKVAVLPWGLTLYYRQKKPTSMYWSNVRGIMRRPQSDAVCKAVIRYYHGRPTEVTIEIADAVDNGYLGSMGVPVRVWDGRRQWGD
jgi:hypothetical protein